MKKFKRILALMLALILTVSFMPAIEKVAKADEATDGYYAFYMNSSKNFEWKWKGAGSDPKINNFITSTSGYVELAKEYGWTASDKVGNVALDKYAIKMNAAFGLTMTPNCDGEIEFYWVMRKAKASDGVIQISYDGEVKQEYELDHNKYTLSDITTAKLEVQSGNTYTLNRKESTGEAALFLIKFTPDQKSLGDGTVNPGDGEEGKDDPDEGEDTDTVIKVDGYYKWIWQNSAKKPTGIKVGKPVVTGIEEALTDAANGTIGASNYSDASSGKITVANRYGDKTSYDAGYKMSSKSPITFTAPCDGVIEMYVRPRYSASADINLKVNGSVYGDTMTLPEGDSTYATVKTIFKYTIDVEKGETYNFLTSTKEIAVFEVDFLPNAVSTLGASIRPEQKDHTNGIRFGSTIDKTIIDYSKVKESGTLIAAKANMDTAEITELTMDSVDKVCKKVVRTTYLKENDSVIEYAAAVVNIKDDYKDMAIVARPYVVIDGVTYYGEQMTGSFNDVQAKLAAMNVQ